MGKMQVPYSLESHLVDDVISVLLNCSPWGKLEISQEFDYRRGRTDIIAIDENKSIIAFEVKLWRWRHAMHQAYRNGCFANYSYVILPTYTAKIAVNHLVEFKKRSVGLCSATPGRIHVLIPAPEIEPIQPWLSVRAVRALGVSIV